MRPIRLFNQTKFAKIAAFISGAYAFCELLEFIIVVFVNKQNGLTTILNYGMNIVFYIFICSYFIKSESNFFYAFYAMMALLISTYVIPAIFGLMSSVISLQFYIVGIGLVLGILYFVFMFLDSKNYKPWRSTALVVIGSIMLVLSVISLISVISQSIGVFKKIFTSNAEPLTIIINFIVAVVSLLTSALSLMFSFIYFSYPIVLKKQR